jgi:hypothetical protein
LFAVVAWEIEHHRPLWLPVFIEAIVMAVVTAVVALGGFTRSGWKRRSS